MVEFGRVVCWFVVYFFFVKLEWFVVGVDGDWDWIYGGDGFLEFVFLYMGDVYVFGVGGVDVFFFEVVEFVLKWYLIL